MPRTSKPLLVTDEELIQLQEFAKNSDQQIAFRANIVIACIEENENKKVASKLGTSERNVANWKESFRKNRLSAILNSKKVGRPVSEGKPLDLTEQVRVYVQEHPDSWSAGNMAETFQVSVSNIYYVLDKLGITPNQRVRTWTYHTTDVRSTGEYAVLGLLISPGAILMVIGELGEPYHLEQVKGEVVTANSTLLSLLERSETPLTLADVVVTYSQQTNRISHSTYTPPQTFLQDVLKTWENENVTHLHVFAYQYDGASDVLRSIPQFEYTVYEARSYMEWHGQISIWAADSCHDLERDFLDLLLDAIREYDKMMEKGVEPIFWKLLPGREKVTLLKESTALSRTHENVCQVGSLEQIDQEEAQQAKGASGRTEVFSEMEIRFPDGSTVRQKIQGNTTLMPPEDFDMTTMEGFEKGINELDRVMSELARKVDVEGRNFYLEEVKKNKKSSLAYG